MHPLPVFPYPYMMHPAVAAAHAAAFGAYPYAHPAVAAAHAAARPIPPAARRESRKCSRQWTCWTETKTVRFPPEK